jgi:hypothetical protein
MSLPLTGYRRQRIGRQAIGVADDGVALLSLCVLVLASGTDDG